MVASRRLDDPDLDGERRRVGAGGAGISDANGGGWFDALRMTGAACQCNPTTTLEMFFFENPLVKRYYPVY